MTAFDEKLIFPEKVQENSVTIADVEIAQTMPGQSLSNHALEKPAWSIWPENTIPQS